MAFPGTLKDAPAGLVYLEGHEAFGFTLGLASSDCAAQFYNSDIDYFPDRVHNSLQRILLFCDGRQIETQGTLLSCPHEGLAAQGIEELFSGQVKLVIRLSGRRG